MSERTIVALSGLIISTVLFSIAFGPLIGIGIGALATYLKNPE